MNKQVIIFVTLTLFILLWIGIAGVISYYLMQVGYSTLCASALMSATVIAIVLILSATEHVSSVELA